MTDPIEPLLARLPEPVPHPTLEATVMARIAREPDRIISDSSAWSRPASPRDRLAWLFGAVGLTLVIGLTARGWIGIGSLPDIVSPRIGLRSLVLTPVDGGSAVLLCAGLWLFLVGLLAPLRR